MQSKKNDRGGEGSWLATLVAGGMALVHMTACGAENPGNHPAEEDGEVRAPITGGALLNSWAPIVRLNGCSGTKLSSQWYLTAWHCSAQFPVGSTVQITNSGDGVSGATTHTVSEFRIHPTTIGLSNGLGLDLALLKVFGNNSVPPVAETFGVQPAGSGTAFGYGCDNLPGSTNGGKKQFAQMAISSPHPMPGAEPLAFFSNGTNPALCPGDSGGPFYRQVGTQWFITGVNSAYGTWPPSNVTGSSFARTSPAREWIAAVSADSIGHNDFSNQVVGTFINWWSNYCAAVGDTAKTIKHAACTMADDPLQRFRVEPVGGGYYQFRNLANGSCLGIKDASTAEGALVTTTNGCNGAETTKWAVTVIGDSVKMVNKNSGKCMMTDSINVGDPLLQRTCQDTFAYRFIFSK